MNENNVASALFASVLPRHVCTGHCSPMKLTHSRMYCGKETDSYPCGKESDSYPCDNTFEKCAHFLGPQWLVYFFFLGGSLLGAFIIWIIHLFIILFIIYLLLFIYYLDATIRRTPARGSDVSRHPGTPILHMLPRGLRVAFSSLYNGLTVQICQ